MFWTRSLLVALFGFRKASCFSLLLLASLGFSFVFISGIIDKIGVRVFRIYWCLRSGTRGSLKWLRLCSCFTHCFIQITDKLHTIRSYSFPETSECSELAKGDQVVIVVEEQGWLGYASECKYIALCTANAENVDLPEPPNFDSQRAHASRQAATCPLWPQSLNS